MSRSKLTKAQMTALHTLYQRNNDTHPSYLSFRRSAHYSSLVGCVMVQWCGMWIGIEEDGYAHS